MKKGTVISLIVAGVLILGGAALIAVGLYTGGGNTYATNIFSLEERKVTVDQTFESVVVETGDCDVTFVPFNGNADPHIVFLERAKISHHTSVQDGVLKIRMIDHRQWMDYIGIGGESMKMTVYLPRKQYESLHVTTDTGDIQLPGVLSAKEIQLSSDTGDVRCEAAAKTLVNCTTDTGDIAVKNCAPAMLELQSDTGDVLLENITTAEIRLKTDTGEIDVAEASCTILTCESDTGDVQVKDSNASITNIKTNTGDVRLPKDWQQKDCRIETDTGKIRFE